MTEIQKLDSKVVYQNRWMTVREDRVMRPSGTEGIYGVVDKLDFVVIVPVQDGYIHIVEQYRYPVGERFWELPQGAWEHDHDAEPAEVAAGELREETGLIAGTLIHVGYEYLAYGYSSQGYHIYLAKELEQGPRKLDPEEEGLITKRVTIAEFEAMICSGEIKNATSVNAYCLTKLKGML